MIPPEFLARLEKIVPADQFLSVRETFSSPRAMSIRINPLRADISRISAELGSEGVSFLPVDWSSTAYLVTGATSEFLGRHRLITQGMAYQQSLSSMIPPVVLEAKPGEKVLDACAAPGSKTTQISAMMNATGLIVAVEAVKNRFFRLKSVCDLLGASNVSLKLCDVRRFRPQDGDLFDRIMVDVPCSSEGRFREDDKETTAYWSLRKIREMSFKQKGILMSVSRLLRPGGVMVYSTCTFSPEENEEVIDWFLSKNKDDFFIEEIFLPGVPRLPCVSSWGRRVFHDDVKKCWRVRPDPIYSGFFVAKIFRRPSPG